MDEVLFGRYRLISLIGEGGMGKVFKAHDTEIGRDVAIKLLPTELGTQPGYRERFRREAHTAARLTEPHIIPIYDTGEIDGQMYLVMPVIDGVDIQSLLKRDGAMDTPRAVRVVEQLAAALDTAHEAGLVHRDVKPSNALMARHDFVYLIDFGVAHDPGNTKLTKTGAIIGTLAYMAPERFLLGTADARGDVYALACVLHECVTGAQPFPGDSAEQQIGGHLTLDPPTPSHLNPSVPAGFDEVIARGMAKNPEQRYQSAHELATAARHALTRPPPRATPRRRPMFVDQSAPPPSGPSAQAPGANLGSGPIAVSNPAHVNRAYFALPPPADPARLERQPAAPALPLQRFHHQQTPTPSDPALPRRRSRRAKIVLAAVAALTVVVVIAVAVVIALGKKPPSGGSTAGGSSASETSSGGDSTDGNDNTAGARQRSNSSGGVNPSGSPPSSAPDLLSAVPSADKCSVGEPDIGITNVKFTVYCEPGTSEVRMLRYSVLASQADVDSQISDDAPEMWQKPCGGGQGIQKWSGGEFVCYARAEYPYIEWSVSSRNILGLMGGPPGGSIDDVYRWWAKRYQ